MNINARKVFCDWPCWEMDVILSDLYEILTHIADEKGELLALWGSDERAQYSGFVLHLFFVFWEKETLYLRCMLSSNDPCYPDLSGLFPVAHRLQRSIYDLLGFKALGSEDDRPWLRHSAWPKDKFPLRHEFKISDHYDDEQEDYHFVRVGGAGVHEMAVGPVHAAIIEPGHFRFHVVGEHVLRMEERFGYAHKGMAKHFQGSDFEKGTKLAGRVSGDSTVAYAWAYCMALENAHQTKVPERATWLRALLLERERIANHLADLGVLGKDAGLTFAFEQFSRLKENVLRTNHALFKSRYAMGVIIPGGINQDITSHGQAILKSEMHDLRDEVSALLSIMKDQGGLQDRFALTGTITPDLATRLGMLGLSARASSRHIDWRKQMTYEPYSHLKIEFPHEHDGDVAARVSLRFKELFESLSAILQIIDNLPNGSIHVKLPKLSDIHTGLGCVEGWRGPVFVALCNQDADHLLWVHMHDPSWQNWPALEYAVMGNIVPDFPLINKSFNLSYSGCDG